MTPHTFTHVALRVEHLRHAETLYRELFALEVAFRDAETAERAGVDLGLVMLYRDGLRLALEGPTRWVGAAGSPTWACRGRRRAGAFGGAPPRWMRDR